MPHRQIDYDLKPPDISWFDWDGMTNDERRIAIRLSVCAFKATAFSTTFLTLWTGKLLWAGSKFAAIQIKNRLMP